MNLKKLSFFQKLIETVHTLRAPGGCPWDRAQTHASLRKHLLEETYEVLEVLDQIAEQNDSLEKTEALKKSFQEELGDLLMQVLIHAELAQEKNLFDIFDVIRSLNEKLIYRHPHVFEKKTAHTAKEAYQNWEKRKKKSKKHLLSGVPANLPALLKTYRVIQKISSFSASKTSKKTQLSVLESLMKQLLNQDASDFSCSLDTLFGKLLFTLCHLAYLSHIDPEEALRQTTQTFEKRFYEKEKTCANSNQALTVEDSFWNLES